MYHAHLKGTHYEIGFHWGSLLEKHGHFILNNLPFPIKKDRKAFALACVPVYQKYFPEILEEIQAWRMGSIVRLKCSKLFYSACMPCRPPAIAHVLQWQIMKRFCSEETAIF